MDSMAGVYWKYGVSRMDDGGVLKGRLSSPARVWPVWSARRSWLTAAVFSDNCLGTWVNVRCKTYNTVWASVDLLITFQQC